jgi:hypothetical protein
MPINQGFFEIINHLRIQVSVPPPDIQVNPAVIAVGMSVAVAALDSVKAFQRNNAFHNQGDRICGIARVIPAGNLPNDRFPVVKRLASERQSGCYFTRYQV